MPGERQVKAKPMDYGVHWRRRINNRCWAGRDQRSASQRLPCQLPSHSGSAGEAFQNSNQTRPPSQSHHMNMMRDTDKQVTDVNMLSKCSFVNIEM